MITVVTSYNSDLYAGELDQMFRLRHDVLVGQRGWDLEEEEAGVERDIFDHGEAIYLVAQNEADGPVVGCIRIVPTMAKNLLGDVFPYLCDLRPLPRSEDVYDASRIVVAPGARQKDRAKSVTSEILCGWYEAGVALGLSSFSGTIETAYLDAMLAYGWKVRPLGTPQDVNGDSVIAIEYPISPEHLAHLRGIRKFQETVLSRADIGLLRAAHQHFHLQYQINREAA